MSLLDEALAALAAASTALEKGFGLITQHKMEQDAQKKAIGDAQVSDEPDPKKP